jgi:uncharacterized repeat protein (TIGR01451 family)
MKLKTLALAITATVASFTASAETAYQLPISNTATLEYTVSGDDNSDTATIAFNVDRKVTFVLSGPNNDRDVNAGITETSIFTLENTSNAPVGYKINTPTDPNVKYYIDINNDGLLDDGEVAITAATAAIQLLQNTGSNSITDYAVQIIVEIVVPGNAGDTTTIDYSLVTTAVEPITGNIGLPNANIDPTLEDEEWDRLLVQTVVDNSSVIPGDVGIIRTENGTYTIIAANVSLAKAVRVIEDPITGLLDLTSGSEVYPKAIPGATVEYALTITNSGQLAATGITVTDDVPAPFDLSDSYEEIYKVGGAIATPGIAANTLTFSGLTVPAATGTGSTKVNGETVITFTVQLP